jgi:ATP-dependent DNA helicase PIF1
MNQLIGERDWSAQEACHILLDQSLQYASRVIINVDCRPETAQASAYVFSDGYENKVQETA